MADKPDKGTGLNLLLFFIIAGAVMMSWVQGGGPTRAKNTGLLTRNSTIAPSVSARDNSNSVSSSVSNNYSQYKGKIRLSSGTARSTYQPNQEYVIISASGNKEPINIGGWVLRNDRDKKKYVVYGNTVQGQSVSAVISGTGYYIYHPFDANQNRKSIISLKSGEKAYVITGSLPTVS